eukprot:g2113.t1
MPNKNKQQPPSMKPRNREFRRAELIVLEAQKTVLEQRIQQLENVGEIQLLTGSKLKRNNTGLGLTDRSKGNKRAKTETPVTLDEIFNECRKLLNQLKRNKLSEPFSSPVDPVELNCPDYFTIVKHPMDFKTIANKLRAKNRRYNSPLEFRDDMRIVFKNCMLYNPVGNQIRVMGDRLSDAFEILWKNSNLEKIYHDRASLTSKETNGLDASTNVRSGDLTRSGQHRGPRRRRKKHTVEYSLGKLIEVHNKIAELTSMALNKSQSGDAMDLDQPMEFWQKRQLSQQLDNVPVEKLRDLHPLLQELDEGESVFDTLHDTVLWKMNAVLKPMQNRLPSNIDAMTLSDNTEQPFENVQQSDSQQQQLNVQSPIPVLKDTTEQDMAENFSEIPAAVEEKMDVEEEPVQKEENQNGTHSTYGCCGREIVKKAPQSNGNDDLMEETASGALL